MDVGVYTRLSVAKTTAEATSAAIRRQLEPSMALAAANGWRVVEHYSDVDASAYRAPGRKRPPTRPAFERMLRDVEADRIQGIVFLALDRLVRDHGDFERALATCEPRGAVLACVLDPLDPTTPTGEAMARRLVTFSWLESRTTSLRIAARKEQAARSGRPAVSAWRPYGYAWNGLDVIEPEAHVVRQAARRLLAGWSLNEVTATANATGATGTTGRPFNATRFKKVLTSPRIAGLRSYKGEVVAQATWPAILDQNTWESICAILSDPTRSTYRRPRRWLLAGGLARCGYDECRKALTVKPAGKGNPRYVCDNRPGRGGCGRIAVSAPALEAYVEGLLFAYDWRHLNTPAVHAESQTALAEEIAAAEGRAREITHLHARGRIHTEEWLLARDDLAAHIEELRARLDEARRVAAIAVLPTGGKELRTAWAGMTLEQRRATLKQILVGVVIKPATRRGLTTVDPDRIEPIWRS